MSLTKQVEMQLPAAQIAITESLQNVGFGILSQIDVAATLNAKLGISRNPLVILGACNPNFANEALNTDPSFALMMPCNVVLEESEGFTRISIVDPIELINNPGLQDLATNASRLLQKALDDLN